MVIPVSLGLLLKSKIKRKPLLLVLMELMLIDVCLLVCAMLLLLFKDACLLFFMVFVKKLWRYSWTISPSMELLLIIVCTIVIKVLQRCEETNLVLNWEKCHFMGNEGIVLGHKISERGIEVDRAKVEATEKMPCPRDVKCICSVLGHASFIGGLLKISLRFQSLLLIFFKKMYHLFLMMIVRKLSKLLRRL
jgi:hypothetical protein